MGVVYKAHDTHLDRLVAIKILHADKVADRDRRQRFVQEADQLLEFAIARTRTCHVSRNEFLQLHPIVFRTGNANRRA